VRYLPDQKNKIETVAGSHCSKFIPNRFTFGGVSAERVQAVLLQFCPIEYFHDRHFEPVIKFAVSGFMSMYRASRVK